MIPEHYLLKADTPRGDLYWSSLSGWTPIRDSAARYHLKRVAESVRADLDTDMDVVVMRIVGPGAGVAP